MFKVSALRSKEEYTYWFKRISLTQWQVYYDSKSVATLDESNMVSIAKNSDISDNQFHEILDCFEDFKKIRPEYLVGTKISDEFLDISDIDTDKICALTDYYNKLITGVYLLTIESEEKALKLANRCINWLADTDFYTAPASTIYHDSCTCGLIKHSLKVVNKALELCMIPTFSDVDITSAVLVALVHDWCKIDFYESYMKNVKDEETGQWNKVLAYKYSGSKLPFGHGITSMFIAQKFFNLTTEQALAIRWHMGEYNVCDAEKHDLMDANEKYPTVLLLQHADRLAIL